MRRVWFILTALAGMTLVAMLVGCEAQFTGEIHPTQRPEAREHDSTPKTQPAFQDELENYDIALWHMANGWTNGAPFWVGWRSDHIEFADGVMKLRLDDQPCTLDPMKCSGQPYASGEYRSNGFYHYGCVKGRFKAAQGTGVVTSLFIYTGPSDGNRHDEIDIEILGKDTTQVQVNYFSNGTGNHETLIDLGFDASEGFHTYAFEWSSAAIRWYVDGKLIHVEDGSKGALPVTPGRIMMNLWAGTGVDSWLGPFAYPGSPIYAFYDSVSFTPSQCE